MAKKGLRTVNNLALWFVVVGAVNWLLVSLANFNLVESVFGAIGQGGVASLVYTLIGASGGWIGIQAVMGNVNVKVK